jgi:DNA-binding transcriptional LysR family regulator
MERRIPSLNALRAFESAARLQSFSKAAAELDVTQGAISRQIKGLEEFLGFDLFDRVHAGVLLTPVARTYASKVLQAFDLIGHATDELLVGRKNAVSPGTVLTIHGYSIVLDYWLTPLLSRFQLDHPEIVIRFFPKAGNDIDFADDDIDVSIQLWERPDRRFNSDFLFADELAPMCSPLLLKDGIPLRSPLDLARLELLHARQRADDWRDWFTVAGYTMPPRAFPTTIWEFGVLYDCLLQGRGVAMVHLALTEHLRDKGDLIVPFSIALRRESSWHLVSRPEDALKPKIVLFRRWLLDQIASKPHGLDFRMQPSPPAASKPVENREIP